MTIAWRHVDAVGNETGIAKVLTDNAGGTHATNAGGFAEVGTGSAPDPETDPDVASGFFPSTGIVPLSWTRDSLPTTSFFVTFACAPGAHIGAHVWWEV